MAKVKKSNSKHIAKKIVTWVLVLAVLGGGGWWLYQLFFVVEALPALTAEITYGSLATTLEGTGTTTPADSESISLSSTADIQEVFVSAGDMVTAGDPLYIQDDSEIDDLIETYQAEIDNLEDTLDGYYETQSDYQADLSDVYVTAPFTGKLTGLSVEAGDKVQNDGLVATLIDDTVMTVTQYFSYAYEDEISVGVDAKVSIADQMLLLDGWVSDVTKVDYVSPEGTRCFAVTISVNNPGSLTKDTMVNAFILGADGSKLQPVEAAELDYAQEETLRSNTAGEILSVNGQNYQTVTAGTTIVTLDTSDISNSLESISDKIQDTLDKIETYNEKIAEANEMRTDFAATAGITGKVIQVNASTSRTPSANQAAVMIYDLTTMMISANIDELDIDFISMGMPVDIFYSSGNQTKEYQGYISEISYEATNSNGVAYFPVTIVIESNGELASGVNVSYSIALGNDEEGYLVPVDGLKSVSDGYAVFVKGAQKSSLNLEDGVVPDGFYAVPVAVHSTNTSYGLVLEGLEDGMEIFTRYQQSAPSGGDSTSETGEEAMGPMSGMTPEDMQAMREEMGSSMGAMGGMNATGGKAGR